MLDIFDTKDIAPMLIGKEVKPYDDKDSIFELKLDGIRAVVYLDNNVIIKNKRNKDVTNIYPELKNMCKSVKKRCILDGELITLKAGKPYFLGIKKRSLLTNSFKINMAIKKYPVTFVAFDILYLDNKLLTNLPLIERKKILNQNVIEGNNISISRYILEYGKAFFELAKENDLEGIVGKKMNSLYFFNVRTKDWKKIKTIIDEDLIVCGFGIKENEIKYLILGTYDMNKQLNCRGKISLGISKEDKKIILDFYKDNKVNIPWFLEYKDANWLKLELVGCVHYMQKTETGKMRQPVWKGLRFDKEANECIS